MTALGLYVVLARDWSDFLDMLPSATSDVLADLLLVLELPPAPGTDGDLNQIGAKCVRAEIERRGAP